MLRLHPWIRTLLQIIAIASLVLSDVILGLFVIKLSSARSSLLPTLVVVPSATATLATSPVVLAAPFSSNTPLPVFTNVPTTTPLVVPTREGVSTDTPTELPSATPTPRSLESMQTVTPQDDSTTEGTAGSLVKIKIKDPSGTQARSGPGISYDVVSQVAFNADYTVRASAKDFFGHTWYLVNLPGRVPAWILGPAATIIAGNDAAQQVAMARTIPPTPTLTPSLTLTPASGMESQLQAVPVLSGIGPELNAIYLKGQQLGNHPNVFAKVGDCNTKSDAFLMPIDHGLYRLGRFASLQDTISMFRGSFGRDSIAAQVGFNVASAQDNFWADPKVCKAEEGPVDCEYRLTHPSIAIIMFGANDALFFTPAAFRKYMSQIIEKSLDDGIIPVLMTFTWHDRGTLYPTMLEFNLIDVSLSQQYHIPLINFWLASQYLPGHGIVADNAHLTWSVHGLDFTGEQSIWGQTLRSLLALEMLNDIQLELNSQMF